MQHETESVRRPLVTRSAQWVHTVSALLVNAGLKPNHVSVLSVVFATCAGSAILYAFTNDATWRGVLLVAAAVCIQLRLLCNLLDGLMAVEGGLKSKSGEIYNDLPDRIADAIILICAGYAVRHIEWSVELGWTTAVLAIITAYVRVLGGSTGINQDFCGPMAKPHRMAVLTGACLLTTLEPLFEWNGHLIFTALIVIAIGCVITIIRRTVRIIRKLEART